MEKQRVKAFFFFLTGSLSKCLQHLVTSQPETRSSELNLNPGLSLEWQGPKFLDHHVLPSSVHISRKLKSGVKLRLKPRHLPGIFFCWFTPQIPATARAGSGESQELRVSSRSPTWVREPKYLSHHLLPSYIHISSKLDQKERHWYSDTGSWHPRQWLNQPSACS